MKGTANVAVLLFDDVDVLDFCGPVQVFSAAQHPQWDTPFHVFTCAENTGPVWTRDHLSIIPRYPLHNCPAPDLLVVPGGSGAREQMSNARLISWLKATAPRCQIVLSVCTGALLLAKAGLLDGLRVTTHHQAIGLLRETAPRSTIHETERFIDNGQIVVAAGVSAGIDASLHVVSRLLGQAVAQATAQYMEYSWQPR